jgi:hypothetical protein
LSTCLYFRNRSKSPHHIHGLMRSMRKTATTEWELTKNWIGSFTTGIKMSRLNHFTMKSELIRICGKTATKWRNKLWVICLNKRMGSNTRFTVSQMLMQRAIPYRLVNKWLDSDKRMWALNPIEKGKLQGLTDYATIRNHSKAVLFR